ncbi:MAG: Ig-like domain-containing protein, partial [Pseudomonadota bacterium]
PPDAVDDAFTTAAGAARVLTVATDLLGNDSDDDGDDLSILSYGAPQFGTLTVSPDGTTVTYTPDPGHSGSDSFTYTLSDGTDTDVATVTIVTDAPPPQPGDIASDDFDTSVLSAIWSIEGPAEASVDLGTSSTDAFIEIGLPAEGRYDAWGTNTTARLMQEASNEDLVVSAG